MKLAKPRIDIGFATNDAPAALAFWQNEIGLPFDYTQPIRRGYKQHRHDLCGSVLKINQVYEPIPDNPPSGYRELLIARDGIAAPKRWSIRMATGSRWCRGMFGIERIGIVSASATSRRIAASIRRRLACRRVNPMAPAGDDLSRRRHRADNGARFRRAA
jgi:hypothetical protein